MGTDGKARILIVEDDGPLAGGLCRALQNETTETVSCPALREAEALLEAAAMGKEAEGRKEQKAGGAFTLVILDVNLPDGNGFDFLQKIKRKYDISVIILTANDMETDIVAGLELGADDYITKPFSLAVLRARVAAQLRRMEARFCGNMIKGAADNFADRPAADTAERSGNRTAGMSISAEDEGWIVDGSYRFHFARMLFYQGEKQIELSKGEQKLLRIFVENRGITLTREQLLDRIWSVDAVFVDENTLSVTVKRLRDKLGAQERIRTVYGIGYRWE